MKRPYFAVLPMVICAALLAQQPPSPPPLPPPNQALTPNQLDDLVAPVALYPDPMLGQILAACTYPLEIVQVSQWLARNQGLAGPTLTQAAQQQNWDPSVQALVVFPDLVQRLNQDITWTTNLGNAFLNQQSDVMEAVQRMRQRAQQGGKLSSTPQQTVSGNNGAIEIEPADPQTMYLPYYDPMSIWGPPLYYPYANWGYPPFGAGMYFGFGAGINMGFYFGGGWGGWGGWGWQPGWGGRNLIVNNSFIHRNNFNASRGGSLSGRSTWAHDASHRGGVPYSNAASSQRYGGAARQNLQRRAAAQQRQAGGATRQSGSERQSAVQQTQARGATRQSGAARQSGSERIGNREISSSTPAQNRSAFGGVREGSAARAQSDHGFSSMGPSRSGGGGMRGGGGGGRGGGGHR